MQSSKQKSSVRYLNTNDKIISKQYNGVNTKDEKVDRILEKLNLSGSGTYENSVGSKKSPSFSNSGEEGHQKVGGVY